MILSRNTLAAWGSQGFTSALKKELEATAGTALPLQQGLSHSSIALPEPVDIVILSCKESGTHIHCHASVFYTGIIGGCSCADDPTPMDRENEHCEIDIRIDRHSGKADIALRSP